jgi:hypothetical protein
MPAGERLPLENRLSSKRSFIKKNDVDNLYKNLFTQRSYEQFAWRFVTKD